MHMPHQFGESSVEVIVCRMGRYFNMITNYNLQICIELVIMMLYFDEVLLVCL